ncbi:methylamine utilization protein [Silicimonas algicola]|uniref:Cytochrome c peroxidase n=1 Tax=Silicimonas algicola TaxID=1826607 RepID=A0A316FVG4_9RHOB|nr:cytochrome c peroxidase [Silicimonas algicola]AZQ67632.1 methylamine utilization protein [Silicimonas algicola]PWK51666.1 cytochrome c peroxidase [Silicimonas algicola]
MRQVLFALPLVAAAAGTLAVGLPAQMGSGWSEADLALVRSLSLDTLPPVAPDPSNRVAEDPRAAKLGREFFFETRFSSTGEIACATCHLPDRQFQDDHALAQGVGRTDRRTMPIAGMARSPFLFWDGRKDSLWAQALGPLESAVEHGGDRTQYARLVAEHYADDYAAIFGPLPDLSALPPHAGPVAEPTVAAAWDAMAEADRQAVNIVFANIGKAIAAFERTIDPPVTRFDEWVASPQFPDAGLLTEDEVAGLRVFIGEGQCINCHNGPLLTDNHFHNTGVPAAPGLPEDRGREVGARLVREDPFNCLGPHSDASASQCTELRFMAPETHEMLRAFKTPSLRGATGRPPYMHAGQFGSIDQVIAHYAAAPDAPAGHSELRPIKLDEAERRQIEAFLRSLDAPAAAGGATPEG